MRNRDFDPHPWHFVPFEPSYKAGLGRSGVTIIFVLAMLVLGVIFGVLVPPTFLN